MLATREAGSMTAEPVAAAGGTAAWRYEIKGDVPADVVAEIRRGHVVRNAITAVLRNADDQLVALYDGVPSVAAAQEIAEQAAEDLAVLRTRQKAHKAAGRTRTPDRELSGQIKDASAAAKLASQELKAARKTVREASPEKMKEIRDNTYADVRALYPRAVSGELFAGDPVLEDMGATGGLYWATFNLVANQQLQAFQRVIKLRMQGCAAQLSFRRWDGTALIAVQLQREAWKHGCSKTRPWACGEPAPVKCPSRKAGDPLRTPAMLANPKSKWGNIASLTDTGTTGHRALPVYSLSMRIGSGSATRIVTLPVFLHRQLPDCDIPMMQLTRWREGSQYKASVSVTVLGSPAPPAGGNRTVAVHHGWRVLPDGSLRVAVITGAVSPPALHWQHKGRKVRVERQDGSTVLRRGKSRAVPVLRDHGHFAELVIPPEMRSTAAHAASLTGIRKREFNAALGRLAAFLADHPEHAQAADPDSTVSRWLSPGRLVRAAAALREMGGAEEITAMLEQWRQQDRHLDDWHGGEARRIMDWRADTYRKTAFWIGGNAGVVVLDAWDMRRVRPAAEDEDSAQEAAARANAMLAAPGTLRALIELAAKKRGISVLKAPAGAAAVHHGCGGLLPAEERQKTLLVRCRSCGAEVDQDVNMLLAMTASAKAKA